MQNVPRRDSAGRVIGEVTDRAGIVEVAGLEGSRGQGFAPAPSG